MNSRRPSAKPPAPKIEATTEASQQAWLMRILDAAIAKVPSVKYALGVAGVFVVVAIVVGLKVDYRVAVIGTLVTFVFMVLMLLFAKLAAAGAKVFVLPVTVLLWAFMLIAITASVLLLTSVFFRYPVDLQGWLRPEAPASSPAAGAAAPSLAEVLARAAPPNASTAPAPLAIDLRVFGRRAGTPALVPLDDGGELATNDDFCIVVSPGTAGYLYVLQQDSAGHVQWLFPAHDGAPYASGSNPVVARLPLTFPTTAGSTFFLDASTGTETVVAAFSAEPWPALEAALRALARPKAPAAGSLATLATFRGIGGMRSIPAATIAIPAAASGLVAPAELQSGDGFLVLRRSFRHVAAAR